MTDPIRQRHDEYWILMSDANGHTIPSLDSFFIHRSELMTEKIYIIRHGSICSSVFSTISSPAFCAETKDLGWTGSLQRGKSRYDVASQVLGLNLTLKLRLSPTGLPRDPPLAAYGEVNISIIWDGSLNFILTLFCFQPDSSRRSLPIFPFAAWGGTSNSNFLVPILWVGS